MKYTCIEPGLVYCLDACGYLTLISNDDCLIKCFFYPLGNVLLISYHHFYAECPLYSLLTSLSSSSPCSARIDQALVHPVSCCPQFCFPQPWTHPLAILLPCHRGCRRRPPSGREQCEAAGGGQRTAPHSRHPGPPALHAPRSAPAIPLPARPQSATEEGPAAAVLHATGWGRRGRRPQRNHGCCLRWVSGMSRHGALCEVRLRLNTLEVHPTLLALSWYNVLGKTICSLIVQVHKNWAAVNVCLSCVFVVSRPDSSPGYVGPAAPSLPLTSSSSIAASSTTSSNYANSTWGVGSGSLPSSQGREKVIVDGSDLEGGVRL